LVFGLPLGQSWAVEGAQEHVDRDTPVSRTPKIKVYLDHWYMLVFISKELFQKRFEWCWKREKVSCL
jgi:hypothetical protein